MSKHTPGPWVVGEFADMGGYDCMTSGVRAGPTVYLDGAQYGQGRCEEIAPEAKDRMMADARLIAAAPEMYEALRLANANSKDRSDEPWRVVVSALLTRIRGEA